MGVMLAIQEKTNLLGLSIQLKQQRQRYERAQDNNHMRKRGNDERDFSLLKNVKKEVRQ
jgi:hypothetical protein